MFDNSCFSKNFISVKAVKNEIDDKNKVYGIHRDQPPAWEVFVRSYT